jgi:hypothetical protein
VGELEEEIRLCVTRAQEKIKNKIEYRIYKIIIIIIIIIIIK